MSWILDHLYYVIIVAFAFASWVKHQVEKKTVEEEERRAREEMAGDDGGYGQLENWTVPEAPPAQFVPPPLTHSAGPPPLRAELSEIDAMLKHQQGIQERLKLIEDSKAATTANTAESWGRVSKAGKARKSLNATETSLRASLRDPRQTRRAVVLREILGPPVGLR